MLKTEDLGCRIRLQKFQFYVLINFSKTNKTIWFYSNRVFSNSQTSFLLGWNELKVLVCHMQVFMSIGASTKFQLAGVKLIAIDPWKAGAIWTAKKQRPGFKNWHWFFRAQKPRKKELKN